MLPIQRKLTPYNFSKMVGKKIEYIVIHYVGSVSSAKNNADYFANNQVSSSAHYFVDETSIWQSVEDTNMAWHCGGGLQGDKGHTFYKKCSNLNSIGIEMCCKRTSSGHWYFQNSTVQNTVELVRHLMVKYNVPLERVIRHYDVTGKICPEPYVDEREWEKFKNRLIIEEEKEMAEKVYKYTNELPDWARPTIQKLLDKGYYNGASPDNLNLPESMMRTFVVLDRVGIFDK